MMYPPQIMEMCRGLSIMRMKFIKKCWKNFLTMFPGDWDLLTKDAFPDSWRLAKKIEIWTLQHQGKPINPLTVAAEEAYYRAYKQLEYEWGIFLDGCFFYKEDREAYRLANRGIQERRAERRRTLALKTGIKCLEGLALHIPPTLSARIRALTISDEEHIEQEA